MRYKTITILAAAFVITAMQTAGSQDAGLASFRLLTRYSFYTTERSGEFLLHVPQSHIRSSLEVHILRKSDTLASWQGRADKIVRIPFTIGLPPSQDIVNAVVTEKGPRPKFFNAAARLAILQYKPNEVKIDRLTGGLIVNKLPFFPFGFYTYSPVDPTLPEEEVVRGFNVISPYQKILPETLAERKAYMDRCAQLGMKVHYNLLSVSGGGGVGSNITGLSKEEKRERLIAEIRRFRDHPALLAWYIADEPNGYRVPPAEIEEIYNIVRENDPWHPVTVVFMAPFLSSKRYEEGLDIVMADPYPVPDYPATMVGDVTRQLRDEFTGRRPVWMVPQAFGGGELWKREPSIQELRSMTWQSIVNGATGIQFFVRQGPNYFPKSPAAWAECGRMAMEVAEITPWLLSDEDTWPVVSSSKNVAVSSRMHDGKLIVIAVNKVNEPVHVSFRISGLTTNLKARSLFENRQVNVNEGRLSDYISPLGTLVYMIDTRKLQPLAAAGNLLPDHGFEDLTSPGIPSACYARPGGDRGATYFLDSRVHAEGDHSLRLHTPVHGKGVTLRFFPVKLKPGTSYAISLWARSDPEQRFTPVSENEKNKPVINYPQYIEISLGDFLHSWFVPGSEWKQYVTFVTIPQDVSSQVKSNLILKMPGQGVAWIDNIRIVEEKH